MTTDLAALADQILSAAKSAGADAADAVAVDGTHVSIDTRGGSLEEAQRSEGVEIGLRVLIGQKQASVSASDTSADVIAEMAARAVAMAREAPDDPWIGLASPDQLATDTDTTKLDLFDPSDEPDPAALEEDARRAEAAALSVEGVTRTIGGSAGYGRRRIHLAATNGFTAGYNRSSRSLSCVAISGEGTKMERDYEWDNRIYQSDLRDAEEIGRIAGERAVARSGARRPKTGAYPVIYDERVASSLVGHLVGAINGAAIARGASFLRNALGQTILPEGLSIIENPHRVRTGSSRLFDAEGLPTAKRALIDKGVLTGWVLDLATARKLGLESTANAGRSPGAPPSPGTSNLALTQGDKSREELMKDMGTGLLVTSMIGSTINPNTGDYSRGASGFWVENGELAYPVNEITIAGNLLEMFRNMTPANDAREHLSTVVPSLLVEGLTLAGD
ncbi:TldD/PmbA family protein [Pelagovum pacificum]|uniref:TldD/PmbA family protein n=1 Tax=Pelagovum pacificum TaxID=2588711 RepID=A0A5C5GGU7_9RHOB|nr:metallopeptidase TldD-related protein [Pelagovum pacificum]QQA43066.1 TldD/PmbA family protein [Pelagovum pacificum]TNY33790.1 TldD/PmbA family protein [Pelagovum pacificum]